MPSIKTHASVLREKYIVKVDRKPYKKQCQ
jgi:hypothetical protein